MEPIEPTDEDLRRESLVVQSTIKAAFGEWQKTDKVVEELQSPTSDDELDEVHALLADCAWDEVDDRLVGKVCLSISLLSTPVFTYYLPTFALAVISATEFADGMGGEFIKWLVDKIGPPSAKDRPVKLGIDVAMMNSAQRAAIVDLLNFFKRHCFGPRIQRRIDKTVNAIHSSSPGHHAGSQGHRRL